MSGTNDRQREERAFERLVVSDLNRERDIMNLDDLPELTAEELAAMNRIPENIIARLWAAEADCKNSSGVSARAEDDGKETGSVFARAEDDDADCALAGAGDSSFGGFFRAPDMAEDDLKKLEESRREVLEELMKNKKGGKNAK